MSIKLRGGHKTADKRLDRIPQFDEKSRGFPIREVIGDAGIRTRSWPCSPRLDQGREGACVGFGWAHELAAWPYVVRGTDNIFARNIYKEAQKIDEWAGENYSGTSVLAGAKIVKRMGYMGEFRWAFGIDDVLATLAAFGPVVIGVNWYEGMFEGENGLLKVEGRLAGGHCVALRSVLPKYKIKGTTTARAYVRGRNSWGSRFGINGDFYLTFEDLDRLLKEDGEACVPVGRRLKPLVALSNVSRLGLG